MTTPLLTIKLRIPPTRPDLVPRQRLLRRLDEGLRLGHQLTLVSAPAGFGKTTLLSAWVSDFGSEPGSKIRVAWLSLDEGDDDPARFLAYLIAALQEIEETVGEDALGALQAVQPPPIETVLATLTNELAAIPGPFVLVLDDYHVIRAQSVHSAVAFLLNHLPPQAHLVISTRIDPPLPIARLRARGQLTELRLADLRFALDEVAEFLTRAMDLELEADDVATLASRTEGWIAGLQMAALAVRSYGAPQARLPQPPGSIQTQRDISGFIRAFTGSDRYILDYLVEEVLQRQPKVVQTFLLQTSILDQLSGPLCDAVTDSPAGSGQATLERLERANLFIVPLDNERRWYRYHRLFADLLRQRFEQSPASALGASEGDDRETVPGLHRRASRWYERNGLVDAAIEHALRAKDLERAADLIARTAEATLMRSEVATFVRWVETLPDELVRARPSLCLFHAWALLLSGRPLDAVESRLRHVDAGIRPDRAVPLRAFVAILQGQTSRAAELSRQALDALPEDDRFSRSVAAWILSLSHLVEGDLRDGDQALGEAARVSQESGNILVAAGALNHLAEWRVRQGQLHEAQAIYERALRLATDAQGHRLPIAGTVLIGLGKLWREWNDLEAATRYLTAGIELTRRWGGLWIPDATIALARIRQAQGDATGARDLLNQARQFTAKSDLAEMSALFVAAFQARIDVAQSRDDPSRLEAAERWVAERRLAPSGRVEAGRSEAAGAAVDAGAGAPEEDGLAASYYGLREYEQITLARVAIGQGRPDKALEVLEPLLQAGERMGRVKRVIEILMLQALALHARGDGEGALAALHRALTLAEPGGYVRLFADEGEPLAALLRQAAARGVAVEYVGKLLAAFDAEHPGATVPDLAPPRALEPAPLQPETLVEPLSERELEVLRLIAIGLSNREIAEELVVAVSTVKWHINNVYGKLDVRSRTQAVARARELEIL